MAHVNAPECMPATTAPVAVVTHTTVPPSMTVPACLAVVLVAPASQISADDILARGHKVAAALAAAETTAPAGNGNPVTGNFNPSENGGKSKPAVKLCGICNVRKAALKRPKNGEGKCRFSSKTNLTSFLCSHECFLSCSHAPFLGTGARICRECFFDVFEREVHDTIVAHKLFTPGDVIAIGASGGKDSTVLAHILKVSNPKLTLPLPLTLYNPNPYTQRQRQP